MLSKVGSPMDLTDFEASKLTNSVGDPFSCRILD